MVVVRKTAEFMVPPRLGDLISEAVREFAKSKGLTPNDYDLWYHDEPIWIVRSAEDTPQGRLVKRVQISIALTQKGLQLVFIPDAYLYEGAKRTIVKRAASEVREKRSLRHPVSLDILQEPSKAEALRSAIVGRVKEAWDAAQSITL